MERDPQDVSGPEVARLSPPTGSAGAPTGEWSVERPDYSPHRMYLRRGKVRVYWIQERKSGAKRGQVPHWFGFDQRDEETMRLIAEVMNRVSAPKAAPTAGEERAFRDGLEAAAKVADDHYAPYDLQEPREAFLHDLAAVVFQAGLDFDKGGSDEWEHHIGKRVLTWLEGKQDARTYQDWTIKPLKIAAAIRALASASEPRSATGESQ